MDSSERQQLAQVQKQLQTALAITPKTAQLLMQIGYSDYRELARATPNELLRQWSQLPGMSVKQAEVYRRAARRMVWLGTQDDPAEQAKRCPDWTMKALVAHGAWSDDYDDLTGVQAGERLK